MKVWELNKKGWPKTHRPRPISDPALAGLNELKTTGKLPSNEEQKEAALKVIEWVVRQRELYEETFEGLDFQEQALSINGQIRSLAQAIQAHVRTATKEAEKGKERNPHETWIKCIEQVGGLCIEQLAALRSSTKSTSIQTEGSPLSTSG
jgi:hypothetical protein